MEFIFDDSSSSEEEDSDDFDMVIPTILSDETHQPR
jgi:hypothetical protein